jgi:hypothetical protein
MSTISQRVIIMSTYRLPFQTHLTISIAQNFNLQPTILNLGNLRHNVGLRSTLALYLLPSPNEN